jgi:hypothetical protein
MRYDVRGQFARRYALDAAPKQWHRLLKIGESG